MIDTLVQAGVVVFGCAAVYLLGCKNRQVARWGCVSALAAEPLWFYGAWSTGQWGVCVMAVIYAGGWLRAIRNHFAGALPGGTADYNGTVIND